MKKTMALLITCLFIILASGCSKKSESHLYGLYYGNFGTDSDYILCFTENHPNQVGILKNLGDMKVNSVFKITYGHHNVTIHTPEDSITLNISKDTLYLTDPISNGMTAPQKYHYGKVNGKLFKKSTADIAYKDISQKAKASGYYMPYHNNSET